MNIKEGIPAKIKVQTKVTQNNETEDFVFDLPGQVVKMGDTLYIRYKEIQPDGQEAPVTVKVTPDSQVQLIRSGETRMRMRFAYREKMETNYKTPYGMFIISTYAKNLHISLKDRPFSGVITIDYDLYMKEEKVGDYQMVLEFTT
ncbi:DUF1934 domain-containing protein [Enterococcus dongliensis]|uniref:DUF1934 domain-containing protein n=1 Tax=Enterococcus dongliensis TaxID=2559925 RepID=UPI002890CD4C|nr:DUF1934 domain-containing protein [Enterococcus dongliensis]MDT2603471.1 DUF1934 domain-containing protein [Enterococcus dongliensis]MDT2644686.1 DUF1934 domain-containing protein [Enterococcus dongliensis]MDT2671143.1 DUF1934 domain-containing protein [Enterococcus dongliensis]MDT2711021.1 DUF1934 domain-containing protein [Enterococcus dongliensis]